MKRRGLTLIEVIVVTGHATMEVVARALHLGAFDYISKPFNDLALVRAAVNRALEKLSLRQRIDEQVVELKGQIEERMAMEAQLVQAREKAELAVEAKSLFLASMSHEIRTPMNGVIGMTDLLLRTELSERQRRFIETIRRSGDALLTIIDDILDWSKIEAGKLNLQSIDFDLKRTVDDVTELLSNQARPKGLLLEVVIGEDVPTALNGDPGRLRQILTNLLGNAIKFTDEGSVRIEIETREESETETLVYFGVVDSGVGISQENQDKLFQSFVQVDGSYTRQHGASRRCSASDLYTPGASLQVCCCSECAGVHTQRTVHSVCRPFSTLACFSGAMRCDAVSVARTTTRVRAHKRRSRPSAPGQMSSSSPSPPHAEPPHTQVQERTWRTSPAVTPGVLGRRSCITTKRAQSRSSSGASSASSARRRSAPTRRAPWSD